MYHRWTFIFSLLSAAKGARCNPLKVEGSIKRYFFLLSEIQNNIERCHKLHRYCSAALNCLTKRFIGQMLHSLEKKVQFVYLEPEEICSSYRKKKHFLVRGNFLTNTVLYKTAIFKWQ